ncbi:MAG: response regulator transcription factor [Pedobacter sp.]|nr:MAG: response regulator transcription factor [Pedobacter sp.]
MEMSCIIIDDEPHAVSELAELIGLCPGVFVVECFSTVNQALQFFALGEIVDVIFSDIEMPGVDGISAASLLQGYCRELVFVTAHKGHALDAFGVGASGYLLKPVGMADVVAKISHLSMRRGIGYQGQGEAIVFIKGDRKHSFFKLVYKEVIFIQAMLNYVKIVTVEGPKMTYSGMKDMEELLRTKPYFFRISKSVIVNMDFVVRVEGNGVYLSNDTSVVIGETYRKGFRDFLRKRTFNG